MANGAQRFSNRAERLFLALFPSPFAIALSLTALTFGMALIFTGKEQEPFGELLVRTVGYWYDGLWNTPMLAFAVQTMLMLILGHVLAITPAVSRVIDVVTSRYCDSNARAAFTVTLLTVLVALFNWGLGLIFGAIFAMKVGENAARRGIPINYPLIGAAGFSGLMVWHGGISGISLAKAAEPGHLLGLMPDESPFRSAVPQYLTYSETIFSPMNVSVAIALVVILPTAMYVLAQKMHREVPTLIETAASHEADTPAKGAERLDTSEYVGRIIGGLFLLVVLYKAWSHPLAAQMGFIDPNWINMMLLGLALCLHGSLRAFGRAVDMAISGAAGILVQFPLYFGIMGIMTGSGLVQMMSDFFVNISSPTTYPVLTFLSAALINIFVPSGGGQWAIQGGIIVNSAAELGLPLSKPILAMAYGDQVTNMLQPFWALPLLGITKLKAKEILPYTLYLMLAGGLIFSLALLVF